MASPLLAYITGEDNISGAVVLVPPNDVSLLKNRDQAVSVRPQHVRFVFTQPCHKQRELIERVTESCFEDAALTRFRKPQPPIGFADLQKAYRPNKKNWKKSFRLLAPYGGLKAGSTLLELLPEDGVSDDEEEHEKELKSNAKEKQTAAKTKDTAKAKPPRRTPEPGKKRKSPASAASVPPEYKPDVVEDQCRFAVLEHLIKSSDGIRSQDLRTSIGQEYSDLLDRKQDSLLQTDSTEVLGDSGYWDIENGMISATEYGKKWYQEALTVRKKKGVPRGNNSNQNKRQKVEKANSQGAADNKQGQQKQAAVGNSHSAAAAGSIGPAGYNDDAGHNSNASDADVLQHEAQAENGAMHNGKHRPLDSDQIRKQFGAPYLALPAPVKFGMELPGWLPPNEWLAYHYRISASDGRVSTRFYLVVNDVVGLAEDIHMWLETEGALTTIQFPDALPSLVGSVTGWYAWHAYGPADVKPVWHTQLQLDAADTRPILVMEVIQGWLDKMKDAMAQAEREREQLLAAHQQELQRIKDLHSTAPKSITASNDEPHSLKAQLQKTTAERDAALQEKERLKVEMEKLMKELAAKEEENLKLRLEVVEKENGQKADARQSTATPIHAKEPDIMSILAPHIANITQNGIGPGAIPLTTSASQPENPNP